VAVAESRFTATSDRDATDAQGVNGARGVRRELDTKGTSAAVGTLGSSRAESLGSANVREGDGESYIQPMIRVYLADTGEIEKVPLESYVRGVVAAEMPLDFEPAALEAQALAARTYIVRRLWLKDRSGVPVDYADVTNTQSHQVYRSLSDMERLREENEEDWLKIKTAAARTAGEVIVYDNEPIEALFFSTSNGFTENSEEVFTAEHPYLRSVASPWDKEESPRAQETVEMSLEDFYTKLGVKPGRVSKGNALEVGGVPVDASSKNKLIRVMEWTKGHRVKQLIAGNKRLTGTEVREKLGLRSASFDWTINNDKIVLTTYGSGHGVGMSQWGAQGMAKAGKTARQIVEYYYSGVHLEKVYKLLNSTKNDLK